MAQGGTSSQEQHGHHIIPLRTLLTVFGALVFLTIFTVISAQWDLGVLNVPLAMLIASTKALMVIMVFMALKYDNRVNAMVFSVGVLFVLLFLSGTLFDMMVRGDVGNVGRETISDQQRLEEQMRERDPGPGGVLSIPALGPDGEAVAPDDTTEPVSVDPE